MIGSGAAGSKPAIKRLYLSRSPNSYSMRSPKFTESFDDSRQLSCAYQPTYGFDNAYVALVASLEFTGNPMRNAAQLWPILPAVRQSSCWQVNAFVKLNEPDVTPGSPPLRR